MNPIERAIRRVDAAQRRHTASALVFGIIKKYGDDNGGVLAGSLAHSGFVSLFPLLLVLLTILGLIASGDPSLRHEALNAVAKQVQLIGHQLAGNVHQLRRSSVIGLVAGLLALTWGTTGLAQAGLHTMAQVWNLPGPARPGYLQRLGRAALFLGVLGLGVIVTTLLTSLSAYGHHAPAIAVLLEALAAAANIGMYLIGFRVLTPTGVPARKLVPGAVAGGLAWTALQAAGTYVVHHFLHSDSVYGVFATVLGLGVIVTTLLTGLTAYGDRAVAIAVLLEALAAAANIGMYLLGFRVLTPKGIPTRNLVLGAVAGGVTWTVLQAAGTYVVHHFLQSDSVYGVFAVVLGLLAWIYLGVEITVYAAEINVVVARRLWPRSIVQPPLTPADRAVLAAQALQNQRRDDQHVEVTYDDRPAGAAGQEHTRSGCAAAQPRPGRVCD